MTATSGPVAPSREALLAYASILEKPVRDPASQTMRPPSEISLAAAAALRFQAEFAPLADAEREELVRRLRRHAALQKPEDYYDLPEDYVADLTAAADALSRPAPGWKPKEE